MSTTLVIAEKSNDVAEFARARTRKNLCLACVAFAISFFDISAQAVDGPQVSLDQAEAFFKNKKYTKAVQAYNQVERTSTERKIMAYCRFRIGQCLMSQKRPGDAFSVWNSMRHYYPESDHGPESLQLEANWHRSRSQRRQLEDTIVRLYPQSQQAASILWRQSSDAFQNGDYSLCINLLEKYLENPQAGRIEAAKATLTAAREARSGNTGTAKTLIFDRRSEEAENLFQKKNYSGALKIYQTILSEPGSSLMLRVRAAQCLAALGQQDKAYSMLQKDMSPFVIKEFVFQNEANRALQPLAERLAKSLSAKFPDARETQLTMLKIAAIKAHRDKDYLGGIKWYRDFLQLYPASEFRASALYQLAAACYYSEDLKAAEEAFQQASEAKPSEALRSEIEKFSNVLQRAKEAADYLAALPAEERDFFNASRLAAQNRHHDAAVLLARLIANDQFRRHSQYPEACYRLGECREKLGQALLAINAYQQCAQADPAGELAPLAILRCGKIYLLQNNLPGAAGAARQLASQQSLPPGAFDFFWQVGVFLLAEGNLESALPWIQQCAQDEAPYEIRENAVRFRQRLAEQPRNRIPAHELAAETAVRIAEDLQTQHQFVLAEALLRRILLKWPSRQSDYVHCLLGRALLKQEKVNEARIAFETVLARHRASPHAAEAALRLAIIHTGWLGEPAHGRRYLETVIQDYPDSHQRPRALFFLGSLEMWNSNPGPSRAAFARLVEEYPQAAESSFALANIEKLKATNAP